MSIINFIILQHTSYYISFLCMCDCILINARLIYVHKAYIQLQLVVTKYDLYVLPYKPYNQLHRL